MFPHVPTAEIIDAVEEHTSLSGRVPCATLVKLIDIFLGEFKAE